ncbi:MAG: hypothetical protein M3245_05790, partial [Actinomycetota bacterium]|nr:hypothetical protein [Actinomycetota bacterium]
TLDLGGDDHYIARPLAGTSTSPSGQGYGALGALGLLVDVAGNDSYDASGPHTTDEERTSAAYGQGVGLGAGFGAVFDLAGADRYAVRTPDGTDAATWVYGQGVGYLLGAAGALVDAGSGADSYVLDAGTVLGEVQDWTIDAPRHNRLVQGQGHAYTGVGVLADQGGQDTLTASAHARSYGYEFLLDPAWEPPEVPPAALVPLAAVWAQGSGIFGGAGYVVAGPGSTTYDASGTSNHTAQASLLVQGFGFLGGAGTVADAGGDDTYGAAVTVGGAVRVEPAPGCGSCRAAAKLEPFVSGVSAQGWGGSTGGEGILLDRDGNDTYSVSNDQALAFRVEDGRPQPPGAPIADLRAWPPPAMGQGWATVDSVGALEDAAGTDTYELRSLLRAETSARSATAPGSGRAEALVLPRLYALGGQGAGRSTNVSGGALLDLGGSGDQFTAVARTDVRTEPNADGVRTVGFLWPPFQGSGDTGVFAALGQDPVVLSSPSQGVCAASTGPRGFGAWSECPVQGGSDRQVFDVPAQNETKGPHARHWTGGSAPRAAGAPPALMVGVTEGEAPGDDRIDATATLRSPEGSPMAGRRIRFNLQLAIDGGPQGMEPSWFSGWEVEAVTDEAGIARATVPADLQALYELMSPSFPGPSEWRLRLLASFDGAQGLHPRHTAHPLT